MTDQFMRVYLDFTPNQLKDDRARRENAQILRRKFDQRIDESVERIWELPAIMVHLAEVPGEYVRLLIEARELFVAGYFYACVAMCGIVSERLIKDMMRACVVVSHLGAVTTPTHEAFDQLEHVETRALVHFLSKTALLNEEAAKSAKDLGELRNRYAHARGRNPRSDAADAIKWLHNIVEGTVSVFKDFEVKDGVLVRKSCGS